MTLPLSPDELLTTTRAVRRRLDLTRPVERAVIDEAIEIAAQAPRGGNRQPWSWIVVEDAATRADLAAIYREAAAEYAKVMPARRLDPSDPAAARVSASAAYLSEHLHEVPLL